MTAYIGKQLDEVRNRIAEAALRVGRDPATVQLVAVSKTFPAAAVRAAWECGQRDFGENRPREGAEKAQAVADLLPEIRWHMIGHVQRRQASWVVGPFALVHSLDRRALAEKLSALAVAAGRELPVLLECNVSGEASKDGYPLAGWARDAAMRQTFRAEVEAVLHLPGLRVEGLMTLAPYGEPPEVVRPIFAALRGLREWLREQFPQVAWTQLSMGMTDDFEIAVEEGATLVRVGRAIFGERSSG